MYTSSFSSPDFIQLHIMKETSTSLSLSSSFQWSFFSILYDAKKRLKIDSKCGYIFLFQINLRLKIKKINHKSCAWKFLCEKKNYRERAHLSNVWIKSPRIKTRRNNYGGHWQNVIIFFLFANKKKDSIDITNDSFNHSYISHSLSFWVRPRTSEAMLVG